STLPVVIGKRSGLSSFEFNGRIDEVRLYSTALTQVQVQADMNTPVTTGPDTTPPTAPGSLAATPVNASQVNLSWTASTDNVGVTGYRVERQDPGNATFVQVGPATGPPFSDTGLTAGSTYNYRVRAADAAGNLSAYSTVVGATTPTPDTTPPSAPGTLTATAVSAGQINLSWG